MNNQFPSSLFLTFNPDRIQIFFQLLENGFIVKGKVGGSVKNFICNSMSIGGEYIDGRIQTIFLNGKPVDDVDSAIVKDGSSLSLSAAMPGIVGATMRRGGALSGMRSGISHISKDDSSGLCDGKATIKFFNLILRELGSEFLNRGVIIEGKSFSEFLAANRKVIEAGLFSAQTDGVNIETNKLFEIKWEDKAELLLKVINNKSD